MQLTYFNRRRLITLLITGILSLILSLSLELYVFGTPNDFFARWFRTFFVFFFLITLTVFGIIPLVNKISDRWLR